MGKVLNLNSPQVERMGLVLTCRGTREAGWMREAAEGRWIRKDGASGSSEHACLIKAKQLLRSM